MRDYSLLHHYYLRTTHNKLWVNTTLFYTTGQFHCVMGRLARRHPTPKVRSQCEQSKCNVTQSSQPPVWMTCQSAEDHALSAPNHADPPTGAILKNRKKRRKRLIVWHLILTVELKVRSEIGTFLFKNFNCYSTQHTRTRSTKRSKRYIEHTSWKTSTGIIALTDALLDD